MLIHVPPGAVRLRLWFGLNLRARHEIVSRVDYRAFISSMCVFTCIACITFISKPSAEEFSGEPFILGSSVSNNGTSGALPSRAAAASQYLDFPGDFFDVKLLRVEMATLPLFDGLSQAIDGTVTYALDSRTQFNIFGQTVTTSDIPVLPLLRGTTSDRLNDPGFRPLPCNGCAQLRDVVYFANLNFIRRYDWEFPRIDISSRPIPVQFSFGATTKYFYEELEGSDYIAQNLNADLGASLRFLWGFDPVTKFSDRNIKLQVGGFELLPTKQSSSFSDALVYEDMNRRWHFSMSWEEGLPELSSTFSVGITQKSEQGNIPATGIEWGFRELLFLRGGMDDDFLSAGASVVYRWMSVHYAFRHHQLGTSLYQVSLQLQWP